MGALLEWDDGEGEWMGRLSGKRGKADELVSQPKPIVHRAGGMLIQSKKEHILQGDMGPGDIFFYYTTVSLAPRPKSEWRSVLTPAPGLAGLDDVQQVTCCYAVNSEVSPLTLPLSYRLPRLGTPDRLCGRPVRRLAALPASAPLGHGRGAWSHRLWHRVLPPYVTSDR